MILYILSIYIENDSTREQETKSRFSKTKVFILRTIKYHLLHVKLLNFCFIFVINNLAEIIIEINSRQ